MIKVNELQYTSCSVSPAMALRMEKALAEWAIGQLPNLCGANRKGEENEN
jgi:hypothetical protein